MPTVTVITVVRDNFEGLVLTAESIAGQDYRDWEHVVIDGVSADGTVEWLRENALGHRTVWRSEPDDGIYDAMNKGLALASGDLVVFLNGGDVFTDGSVLGKVARDWQRRGWVWAYGAMRYIDSRRRPIREFEFYPFSRRALAQARGFVPHPTTVVQTEVMRSYGGFRLQYGFSADQEFATRISGDYSPRVFREVLVDYLIEGAHGASSFSATARRYQAIRKSNDMLVGGVPVVDEVFTVLQASFWRLRAYLSSLRGSREQN